MLGTGHLPVPKEDAVSPKEDAVSPEQEPGPSKRPAMKNAAPRKKRKANVRDLPRSRKGRNTMPTVQLALQPMTTPMTLMTLPKTTMVSEDLVREMSARTLDQALQRSADAESKAIMDTFFEAGVTGVFVGRCNVFLSAACCRENKQSIF